MKTNFLKTTFLCVAVIFLSSCAKESLNETIVVTAADTEMQAKGEQAAKSECEYNISVYWATNPPVENWIIKIREGVCGVDENSPVLYTFDQDDNTPLDGISFDLDHDKDYYIEVDILPGEVLTFDLSTPSNGVITYNMDNADFEAIKAKCPGVLWIYNCPGIDKD